MVVIMNPRDFDTFPIFLGVTRSSQTVKNCSFTAFPDSVTTLNHVNLELGS